MADYDPPQDPYSLGRELQPTLYELFFNPDTECGEHRGVARIHILVADELPGDGQLIKLHALRLKFSEVRVFLVGDGDAAVPPPETPAGANFETLDGPAGSTEITVPLPEGLTLMPETEMVGISVSRRVTAGQRLVIAMRYTGPLELMSSAHDGPVCGLFFYSYSADQHAVATHLEPTNARCLFPCFDEPSFKTRMQVTVAFRREYTIVSNTVMENRQVHLLEGESDTAPSDASRPADGHAAPPGQQVVRFTITPPIPTYLVSFVTGRLQYLATETKRGVVTRVFFSQDKDASHGWYALDLLTKAVEFFEEYFGFELPLAKIDIVGLRDFAVLGMENWGLVCLHEEYMLVSTETPIERRQRIARLIGHEVAHQWFGNIVSLKRWRYVWLKEGFCRYLEYVFVNNCFPRWFIWGDFFSNVLNAALLYDSGPKTHPIEVDVREPRKVFSFFSAISYGKAAGVIRMLASLVGETAMANAMRTLIAENAFKCIETSDFLDAIRASTPAMVLRGIDIAGIVDHWVTTTGHPYIYVERVPEGGGLRVSQFLVSSYKVGALERLSTTHQRSLSTSLMPAAAHFRRTSSDGGGVSGRAASGGHAPPTFHGQNLGRSVEQQQTPPTSDQMLLSQSPGRIAPHDPFVSHPSLLMEEGTFTTPVRAMMVEKGKTSSTELLVLREATRVLEERCELVFFNPGSCSVVRIDYDVRLWEQIFAIAQYLQSIDRLTITTTLIELRAFHVGVSKKPERPASAGGNGDEPTTPLSSGNERASLGGSGAAAADAATHARIVAEVMEEERCLLLLKWVNELCIVQCEKNVTVWKALTAGLWRCANLLQTHPCWGILCKYFVSAYQHLIVANVLSFTSTENPSEFKASHNFSDDAVTDSLQLLCFCGAPHVLSEAAALGERALSYWIASSVGTVLGTTPEEVSPFPQFNVLDRVASRRARIALEAIVTSNFDGRANVVWARCLNIVLFLLKRPQLEHAELLRIFTEPQAVAAAAATAAAIAAAPVGEDAESMASDPETPLFNTAAEPLEAFSVEEVRTAVRSELLEDSNWRSRQAWLELLLPAVLAHRLACTHAPALRILDTINLGREGYLALTRNIGLLKTLLHGIEELGQDALTPAALKRVSALLQAVAQSGAGDSALYQLFGSLLGGRAPNAAASLHELELNCTWANYVSPAYALYLASLRPDLRELGGGQTPVHNSGPVSI